MTPDDARRQWYQEQAERHGRMCGHIIKHSLTIAVQDARLAGHFGRLALGQTVSLDNTGTNYSPSEAHCFVCDLLPDQCECGPWARQVP